jgi:hypothetical protein
MDLQYFWLINFESNTLSVSLIDTQNSQLVLSSGPATEWVESADSLTQAIDQSLSQALASSPLDPTLEPDSFALVLPPFWIEEGKINPPKLKLIESACKTLKLKPLGFVAHDEAIVEDMGKNEGLPVSFILLYLSSNEIIVSLVYLGQVKNRIRKIFSGDFSPILVESALLEIKTDHTLPPQIYVFGQYSSSQLESLKNYPWVGKKSIETFLHLPDVYPITSLSLSQTYSRIILGQIKPDSSVPEVIEPQSLEYNLPSTPNLTLIPSSDLGFFEAQLDAAPNDLPVAQSLSSTPPPPPVITSLAAPRATPQFKLPQLSLPQITWPRLSFSWPLFGLPLILLTFIPLFHYFTTSASLTLFVTPLQFEKSVKVNLDSTVSAFDANANTIPVTKKTLDLTASTTVKTTGNKTVGEKAKGEIVIFNKNDKPQNLAKGSVLVSESGVKFELLNATQVASSSFNLDQGVITLGQTKTLVAAQDIGAQGNIAKDAKLTFKDISANIIMAKANQPFTGGSSRHIASVSQTDKAQAETKVTSELQANLDKRLGQDINQLAGVIPDTMQIKKSRIEFNREIDEEATDLTATISASVTVYALDSSLKPVLVEHYLQSEPDYKTASINPQLFTFDFKSDKNNNEPVKATLRLHGQALPKIDPLSTALLFRGKPISAVAGIIKNKLNRVYDYHLSSTGLLSFVKIMPFNSHRIVIDIKSE